MVDPNIPIALHGFEQARTEAPLAGAPEGVSDSLGDPRVEQKPVKAWKDGETRHYVVQFTHSLFEGERTELQERFGLVLEAYIPKFTYIERVSEQTVTDLGQHELVNRLFPLDPLHKESSGIGQIEFQNPERNARNDFRLWAVLFSNREIALVEETLRGIGATDIVATDDTEDQGVARIVFTVESLDSLAAVAALEVVNWIEEVPEALPNGGVPNGLMQTGTGDAPFTNAGLRGTNEIVGILDEGVLNIDHCWFKDANNAAHGLNHRKVRNRHGTNASKGPAHAVFVSGILCGDDVANTDDAAPRGIAREAKIAYGNCLDFQGMNTLATLYEYLNRVRRDQARIINASWHSNGNPTYSQDSYDTDRFTWIFEECLVVGSAGNTGEVMGAPGTAKNALCVGAAYVDETRSCLADVAAGTEFRVQEATGIIEAMGTVEGGRRKPDLLAPGCNIDSAHTTTSCGVITDADWAEGKPSPGTPTCPPAGQSVYCATSFATPVVTAAAAIVRQYFRQGWYATGKPESPSKTPTAALIKAMLLNATEKVTDSPTAEYPTKGEGWGLLRLNRVLRLEDEAKKIEFRDFPNTRGLFRGGTRTETVTINSISQHLKVTLVWTEPPGDLKSDDPVVNNLDLVVISPTGDRYLGNWFRNGESVIDNPPLNRAFPDPANNVEMVLVKQPTPGPWRITVNATEVNAGRRGQGYALVVRGDLA